ncbi:MAG: hypothetical protein ACR2OM_13905 [Aestuariivirgaceae bacterium]
MRLKTAAIAWIALAALGLLYITHDPVSRPKDETRLPGDDSNQNSDVTLTSGKQINSELVTENGSVSYKSESKTSGLRQQAMAVENVMLARELCGVELTELSRDMLSRDKAKEPRPFSEDRSVLANLWRETFKCNPDFAGQNCFAARWQMCQRAYEEYGPDGIRVEGLIKAIVKK